MPRRPVAYAAAALGALALLAGPSAIGQTPAAAPSCKVFGPGRCCDPAIAAHLAKEAVYAACGESEATFLGEQASRDACKYFFKVAGEKEEESFVQVYAPPQKEVPAAPNDPFFAWKRVGRAFVTERALSPKAAPMLASSTGIWMPAKGYFVSVNASTRVCTKAEARRLAGHLK